ncbi:MAG: hypothetical protein JSV32_06515 [Dehalococcoidia bacterium]|nr:MAG: hypothetical protein JSV32_06515 [Dehalococcoidia bacterium]
MKEHKLHDKYPHGGANYELYPENATPGRFRIARWADPYMGYGDGGTVAFIAYAEDTYDAVRQYAEHTGIEWKWDPYGINHFAEKIDKIELPPMPVII